MKKTILISLFAVLGFCGVSFAQEDYQGQLSDKKLQSMGILSSGSTEIGSLEDSKQNSVYDYDEEYENLLKSIDSSDINSSYELNSDLLNDDLQHYEDDYDELLVKASEILGEDRVAVLTSQVEDIVFEDDGARGSIEISGSMRTPISDDSVKKVQTVYIKDGNDIINEHFAIKTDAFDDEIMGGKVLNSNDAKSYAINEDTDDLYKNLLADLSDGSGDEVTQLFNLAGEEELQKEEYEYELKDGYPLEDITTVGLFTENKKHFKKCLILKTYGGGTWRTYCQPIAKPTQCTDLDWKTLSTMPIMFC